MIKNIFNLYFIICLISNISCMDNQDNNKIIELINKITNNDKLIKELNEENIMKYINTLDKHEKKIRALRLIKRMQYFKLEQTASNIFYQYSKNHYWRCGINPFYEKYCKYFLQKIDEKSQENILNQENNAVFKNYLNITKAFSNTIFVSKKGKIIRYIKNYY